MDAETRFLHRLHRRIPDDVDIMLPLAEALTRVGEIEEGLEVDLRLAACRPEDPTIRYNLACSLALCGQADRALETLARAVALGYRDPAHLREDPDLESLRDDPRFQAVLRSLEEAPPAAP